MRKALVIGASGGIGAAMAKVLADRGDVVTALSRSRDGLDITDQASVDRVLGGLDDLYDQIFIAPGILSPPGHGPEKALDQISADSMAQVLAVNTVGPALILRHVPRLLPRNDPAVVAVLTARVGSIGDNRLGGWYSYRASKAAANQIVRTAAIEIARKHPKAAIIALHPGTVETQFTQNYPAHRKVSPESAAMNLMQVIDGVTAADSGRFLDWSGQEVPW